MKRNLKIAMLIILIALLTVACTGSPENGAAQVVKNYFQALQAKDQNQMINLSCAAWEEPARLEFDSFAAVKTSLEELVCAEKGKDGDYTLISCSGIITASYGAEELMINLAERTYQTIQESGEWRFCGYR